MNVKTEWLPDRHGYKVGLDRIQESVISSHFMHKMSQDPTLRLYERSGFNAKCIAIEERQIIDDLIPLLVKASTTFCEERASAARIRAADKWSDYGYERSGETGASEAITEALLDKEFSRSGSRYNERSTLNQRIKEAIQAGRTIDMVIPALPFKIPSPLKSRGPLPDLGEANFLLSLYEIIRTVEILYKAERPEHEYPLARFTVVADGSRFNEAVNKCSSEIASYQKELSRWTDILGFRDHIRIVDYRSLLENGLPPDVWQSKQEMFHRAKADYSDALWPILDPEDLNATFQAAIASELDPEHGNPEGRFVSLLKSLVYTMNYRSLQNIPDSSSEDKELLYREMTAHLFHPFSSSDQADVPGKMTSASKETLRRAMLNEVWAAAIHYISEIKSDRDLDEDPILTCLPGYLRWTIHPKLGQIAIATPPILGVSAQAWAGSAVFRSTSRGKIRLCSLPALLLEAVEAIPVTVVAKDDPQTIQQPLFYIDKELGAEDIDGLLARLEKAFTRRRFS